MNTLLIDRTHPVGSERIPHSPRLAIAPGVSAPSQVGTTVCIEGEIYGRQDLLADGEVAGNIMLPEHTLTTGPKASVKARIKAKYVEWNIEASERSNSEAAALCWATFGVAK